MPKHPLTGAGYDREEAWAHEQNEAARKRLRDKEKAGGNKSPGPDREESRNAAHKATD